MTSTPFGPPAYFWGGGVDSPFNKSAAADFYRLTSADAGLTGTGAVISGAQNSQTNGYQIAASSTWFSSVAPGGACVLPETSTPYSLAGVLLYIFNTSTNPINIFAHPADQPNSINGGTNNSSFAVPQNSFIVLQCSSAGNWFVQSGASSLGALAQQVTYYISAAGSDSNNGLSPATPFQTIAKVNSIVPGPGTAFLFRAGDTFSGTLVAAAGGIAGLPITYSSYGDNTTIVTGPPPAAYSPTSAIISSGNAGGFSSADLSWITLNNLTFTGSGIATNTAIGVSFTGLNKSGSGITVTNCLINNYGYHGFSASCGKAGSSPVIWDTWNVSNNKISFCGQDGIKFNPNNDITQNNALTFANVTIRGNVVYGITGQNSTLNGDFTGGGISVQGADTVLIDSNLIHDCALLSYLAAGSTGNSLDGIYCASVNNVTVQNNEVYNQIPNNNGVGVAGDSGAIQIDFGSHNVLIQYNYFHDCFAEAIQLTYGTGVSTTLDVQRSLSNITIRYNIIANCGTSNAAFTSGGGIAFRGIILTGVSIQNLYIYNNTIYATNYAALTGFSAASDFITGLVANNLLICDGRTEFGSFAANSAIPLLLNNAYVGGSPIVAGQAAGSNWFPVTTWLGQINGELLNGANQTVITGPVGTARLAGTDPIVTAPSEGPGNLPTNKGTSTQFCLQPSSPYADAGLDLNGIFLADLGTLPNATYSTGVDFDFKGQTYSGDVIGSISCSRTSALGTDLVSSDPPGRAFNTFAANTLRITTGRGLLIEEARTQLLASPGAPATQTTASLASGGNYILWVNGSGTAVVSAGTGTPTDSLSPAGAKLVASHGRPLTFGMSVTGTVVVTVNGTLNQFQLEADPNGLGPSSFISAIGARDADVVTAATTHPIGSTLQARVLSGNLGGSFLCWFRIEGTIPGFLATRTLLGDAAGTSSITVTNSGAPSSIYYSQYKVGSVTTTNTASFQPISRVPQIDAFPFRQTIGVTTDPTNGQALSNNGGAAVLNSTTSSFVASTSPVNIGNNSGTSAALNGYIERIIVASTPNDVADMVRVTSITPVAVINGNPPITRDFFGNPVPGVKGTISIGAHQPVTPSDVAMLDVTDQSLSGGANVVPAVLATGNITIDAGKAPLQEIINGGAFTITAPTKDGSTMLLVTNNASAGAITFSGFSVGANTGDALTTTNTNKFTISIWRINGISGYRIAAHQ